MSDIVDRIEAIRLLAYRNRLAEAEGQTKDLIEILTRTELDRHLASIQETIDDYFLPRRRARLQVVLTNRLSAREPEPPAPAQAAPETPLTAQELVEQFEAGLEELSGRHIFEWSTYYRDWLEDDFDRFLRLIDDETDQVDWFLQYVLFLLWQHSTEIFQKGFNHQLTRGESQDYAQSKNLNGLQHFLDLPIDFYCHRLDRASRTQQAQDLRRLTSTMLIAILGGFADVDFGTRKGWEILSVEYRSWAHTLAFLTEPDLDRLQQVLGSSLFGDRIARIVRPTAAAIDDLGLGRRHVPLPAISQFRVNENRLDITLRPSDLSPIAHMIELQCYLDDSVDPLDLVEASRRGVAVVVAPLRPDLRSEVARDPRFATMVVAARGDQPSDVGDTRETVFGMLVDHAYRAETRADRHQPLLRNPALDFPLAEPGQLRFYRVRRRSVQNLLRTYESRNGVRLWCSVRRSGKTTAGFDLGSSTGQATIISQTCDTTGQREHDSVFYDRVSDALDKGRRIPQDFVEGLIDHCSDRESSEHGRIVFVLDEYETLFGQLAAFLRRDRDIRFTVVQPLMNQLVRFSRENLLIFLGQQPNAHFIMMDQNQLSPLVRQDPFPLFPHHAGDESSEFSELVAKALGNTMSPDPSFIDGVYAETSGHPYLTVNLLREFVQSLIDQGRPQSELTLDRSDIEGFCGAALTPSMLGRSSEYDFFRSAAAEALGDFGREHSPWLHDVYACMRGLMQASPTTFRCSHADFEAIARTVTTHPQTLLTAAAASNFIAHDNQWVWPRIRLLGRIAAVSEGSIHA
ncbi:hypothetical protein [Actinoplanes rectilineatus]|uniref:hypothetical protein n=1 Tax=Actinoplanes rectilineatus TaxID=113571 RepID=UPI0005F29405|nr:hypothetical protein [Actinoplanes rectilineatus]